MKNLLLATLILACLSTLNAQKKHGIYLEGLGVSAIYSLNYDYRISKDGKLGARVGVSTGFGNINFPIQVNYLLGNERHMLELGAGATITTDEGVIANAAVMYRFQSSKGFMFRIGYSPLFLPVDKSSTYGDFNKILWFWPGASVGYSF